MAPMPHTGSEAGLHFKAHRLLYYPTPGLRVPKKKKKNSGLPQEYMAKSKELSITLSVGEPCVPTALPTVGSVVYAPPASSRNPCVGRCAVGRVVASSHNCHPIKNASGAQPADERVEDHPFMVLVALLGAEG